MLKVFRCSFRWRGRMGAYNDVEVIVVENHKTTALGRVLEEHGGDAKDWEIKEIDQSQPSVTTTYEATN